MKWSKLLAIAAFAFLLGALVVVKVLVQKGYSVDRLESVESVNLLDGFSELDVYRVVFYKGDRPDDLRVLIKNSTGEWIIGHQFDAPINRRVMKEFFMNLMSLRSEVRAETSALWPDFFVPDDKGVHVVLEAEDGSVLRHFIVGYQQPYPGANFLRQEGQDRVYWVDRDILFGYFVYDRGQTFDDRRFFDASFWKFDPKDVVKIVLEKDGQTQFVLVRQERVEGEFEYPWRADGHSQDLDPFKIRHFCSVLADANMQEVVDPRGERYGLDPPVYSVTIWTAQSGAPMRLDVGDHVAESKAYYALVKDRDYIFLLAEDIVLNLNKSVADFIKEKPVEAQPATESPSPDRSSSKKKSSKI